MFSKMQNCTSLGSVVFLRMRQGNFCQKNFHLFSCFRTMLLSYIGDLGGFRGSGALVGDYA